MMKPWKLIAAASALVVWTATLAPPSHAAELGGPSSPALPSSCSAMLTPILAAPAPLLAPWAEALATAPATCACGDAICIGKPLNSRCNGFIKLCQQVGSCAAAAAPRCICASPP
jgi:hypothetical protein